jgi:hypothetical protein
MFRSARAARLTLAVAAGLLAARAAGAQLTPLRDDRQLAARATCNGITDGPYSTGAPAPFAYWNGSATATATPPDAGSADAGGWQISICTNNYIYGAGGASGSWQVVHGSYSASSVCGFAFRVDYPIAFSLDAHVEAADPGTSGSFELGVDGTLLDYRKTSEAGDDTTSGRLSPGTYYIVGRSSLTLDAENAGAPPYSFALTVQPLPNPFIYRSPHDTTLTCGGAMTLRVVITASAAGATFQWRRNFVPLVNSSHLSGATSNALTINNACGPDGGTYDVLVTVGGVTEPSSIAHVALPGNADVAPIVGREAFVLESAVPNPSMGETAFRFSTREPAALVAEVFDAAGRRVRALPSRSITGTGTLAWDGRDESGATARSGIYFLRVIANGRAYERRFVRLR